MKRIAPILALAVACPLTLALARPGRPAAGGIALPSYAPAVVSGTTAGVAWLAATSPGRRVLLASPPAAPADLVGPGGRGDDGTPALARVAGESLLVMAARGGTTARLWSQVVTPAGTRPPVWVPTRGGSPSFPALASSANGVWAVWVESGSGGDRLVAAAWRDGSWTAPEALPGVGAWPSAPAIAVDGEGEPVVVWSQSDGRDAEILVARRGPRRWRRPQVLTRNDVPDVMPDIRGSADRLVVAWSELSGNGEYVAMAAVGEDAAWSAPRRLSPGAAGGVGVASADPPTVVWSEASANHDSRRLTAVELRAGSWRSLGTLGHAMNARHRAHRDADDLGLAWHQADGVAAGTAREDAGWRTTLWRGTARSEPLPRRATNPDTYLAFGDSITVGIIRSGGEPVFGVPYTDSLRPWLDSYLGAPTIVQNAGEGGEFTLEGLVRIRAFLNGQRAALILEGANDMYNRMDPATVATNLDFMVQATLNAGTVPVLSTLMPFTTAGFQDGRNLAIQELNARLHDTAAVYQIPLVDMYGAFFGKDYLYSDEVHPTDAGYVEMARVWFRGIKPLLDQWLLQQDIDLDQSRDAQRTRPTIRGRE